MPESFTSSRASPPNPDTVTSTRPPGWVYWTAFSRRFRTISDRSRGKPWTMVGARSRMSVCTPASRARSSTRCTSSATIRSSRTSWGRPTAPSSRERSSRSETTRPSLMASCSNWEANRGTASGSPCDAVEMVSANACSEATGVFSSWEALATKSLRTASTARASVTSLVTRSTRPSSGSGTAVASIVLDDGPTVTSMCPGDPVSCARATICCRAAGVSCPTRATTPVSRRDASF